MSEATNSEAVPNDVDRLSSFEMHDEYVETNRQLLSGILDSADQVFMYHDPLVTAVKAPGAARPEAIIAGIPLNEYPADTVEQTDADAQARIANIFMIGLQHRFTCQYIDKFYGVLGESYIQAFSLVGSLVGPVSDALTSRLTQTHNFICFDRVDDASQFDIRYTTGGNLNTNRWCREAILTIKDEFIEQELSIEEFSVGDDKTEFFVKHTYNMVGDEVLQDISQYFGVDHDDLDSAYLMFEAMMKGFVAETPDDAFAQVVEKYRDPVDTLEVADLIERAKMRVADIKASSKLVLQNPLLELPALDDLVKFKSMLDAAIAA